MSDIETEVQQPANAPESLRLMIVAGEPSGDAHAAALVSALRATTPHVNFEFFGSAGPQMRAQAVEAVVRADDLAIMGILEVARVFSRFRIAFRKLKEAALSRKPDAVIFVDWPEFNLRLAKSLHRRNLRTIYYISPQVWAWRSYRVKQIRRDVDLLLAILPFEKEWFARSNMQQVQYVGHPLAGEVTAKLSREEFSRKHDLDPKRPIVVLLPGSRHKELLRILPPMMNAAIEMSHEQDDLQFVLVVAPSRSIEEAQSVIAEANIDTKRLSTFRVVHHETRDALAAADAAAVASGTATLEAALLNTPMVIVYKESAVNWHTLGRLITTETYGLVNLVAGRRIVTELIQNDLTPQLLSAELFALLQEQRNQQLRKELHEVAQQLGEGGASERAAQKVLEFVRSNPRR
jgi:lipid-A-disaccharide synthase